MHFSGVPRPALRVLAVCGGLLLLAGLSLLRPSAPTTDPWGWIVWGREITHLTLDTNTLVSPSWKPLPVLFTAPLSLLGDAAPDAWLAVARAAGLGAIVMAYTLGRRMAGVLAGTVAAVGLALSSGFVRALEHGYSEPLLILALLAAVWLGLDRRYTASVAALTVVSLGRPEVWPLALTMAVVAWRSGPPRRWRIVALCAAVPMLWFGIDWLGSGDPLHGRVVAGRVAAHLDPFSLAWQLVAIAGVPLAVLAAVASLAPGPRRATAAVITVIAIGWTLGICLLVALGYPAAPRFMALPAALLCVAGGVGAARVVQARELGPPAPAAWAFTGLILVAVVVQGWPAAQRSVVGSERRARAQLDLRRLASAIGAQRTARCGIALPAGQTWNAGALAWDLHLPLPRAQSTVQQMGTQPRLVFLRLPRRERLARSFPHRRGPWVTLGRCGLEPQAQRELLSQRDR